MNATQTPYYKAGGPLDRGSPSYVRRQADQTLYERLVGGDFCYVLTTRQMGKSSLVVRIAERLRQSGFSVAALDPSGVGKNVSPEQWYDGLLAQLGRQLKLEDELDEFWRKSQLGPMQRWMTAIREVVLPRLSGKLVVFVDEIDSVRSLAFSTDEFFAGIRECHNRRTQDVELDRLSFCLLGVATPSDLIQDTRTTPFNIGRRIELNDFTLDEAQSLANGLRRKAGVASQLMQRVMYWTNGQPYLTQRLCDEIARKPEICSRSDVDRLVKELFLSGSAKAKDDNLQFVGKRVLEAGNPGVGGTETNLANILELYSKVLKGRAVRDDEPNPLVSTLRLSGIVRATNGVLLSSNRVYAEIFDRAWIQENLPGAEKRRQRAAFRKGLYRALSISAVALIAIVSAIWWTLDRYVWLKVEYFNSYVSRWGIPEGIGPLSDEAIHHRKATFKFYKRAGNVEAVEVVDSDGNLTTNAEISAFLSDARDEDLLANSAKPVRWEYSREARVNRSGRHNLIAESAFDSRNRRVRTLVYTPQSADTDVVAYYANESGRPQFRNHSTAMYFHITRDVHGRDERLIYRDRAEKMAPQAGGNVDCGIVYARDNRGLVVRETEQVETEDPDETKPILWFDGCSATEFRYDQLGNKIESKFIDVHGHQNRRHDGSGRTTRQFDQWGRTIEEFYSDQNDNLVVIKNGSAGWTAEYDTKGHKLATHYFDASRNPTIISDGYATERVAYSTNGRPVKYQYFNRSAAGDETPTFHKDGYHQSEVDYNDDGDVIRISYYGKAGHQEPVIRIGGYHQSQYQYNDEGLETSRSYFGRDLKRVRHDDGYWRLARKFDQNGYVIQEEYWGLGEERASSTNKISGWKGTRDERGNLETVSYINSSGEPVEHKDGYAAYRSRYDASGKEIEQCFLDLKGQPALDKENDRAAVQSRYARGTNVGYKDLGAALEISTSTRFLVSGSSTSDDSAMHTTWTYFHANGKERCKEIHDCDFYGRVVRAVRRDADGDFVSGKNSFEARYDQWGRKTYVAFLEEAGGGLEAKKYEVIAFDQWGNEVEHTYFNKDGTLREEQKYAKKVQEFNTLKKLTSEKWFNKEGKLVTIDGAAMISREYFPTGLLKREIYYDSSENPRTGQFAGKAYSYDDSGEVIEERYLAPDLTALVNGPAGNAIMIRKNTITGQPLSVEYRDAKGELVIVPKAGYARAEFGYDSHERKIKESFFNDQNGPIANRETGNHSSAEWTFDEQGKRRSYCRTGIDGQDSLTITEISDQFGNLIETSYLDQNRNPVDHPLHNYSSRRTDYVKVGVDPNSQEWKPKQEQFFDANGERVKYQRSVNAIDEQDTVESYFEQLWEYDEKGRLAKRMFVDEKQDPTLSQIDEQSGLRYAVMRVEFDDDDGSSTTTFLGRRYTDSESGVKRQEKWGEISRKKNGDVTQIIRRKYQHSQPGYLNEESYTGAREIPQLGPNGYARRIHEWTTDGQLVYEAYFDERGSPILNDQEYARASRVFEGGNIVEESFFGARGERVRGRKQYARRQFLYENGKCVQENFFGPDNQPAAVDAGYATITRQFDDQGRLTEEAFFDAKNNPVESTDGFARMTQAFTSQGRCIDRAYYNSRGKPVVVVDPGTEQPLAQWTATYDEQGRVNSEEFLGADGSPRPTEWKFAKVQYSWQGDSVESVTFLNESGSPIDVPIAALRSRRVVISGVRWTFPSSKESDSFSQSEVAWTFEEPEAGQRIEADYSVEHFADASQGKSLNSMFAKPIMPEVIHTLLSKIDPLLDEAFVETAASRITFAIADRSIENTNSSYAIQLFNASNAKAPAAIWTVTDGQFRSRTIGAIDNDKINEWTLRFTESSNDSEVFARLEFFDPNGKPVNCENGYALATVRKIQASDNQFLSNESESSQLLKDGSVVEYFGQDKISRSTYRNAWHRVIRSRRSIDDPYSFSFTDTANANVPMTIKVESVEQGSIAEKAGLKKDDEILTPYDKLVARFNYDRRDLASSTPFTIKVKRQNRETDIQWPTNATGNVGATMVQCVGPVQLNRKWDPLFYPRLESLAPVSSR